MKRAKIHDTKLERFSRVCADEHARVLYRGVRQSSMEPRRNMGYSKRTLTVAGSCRAIAYVLRSAATVCSYTSDSGPMSATRTHSSTL